MQIQLPTLLAKSTLLVTKLFQGNVFFLKTPKSSKLRTSGDSVSTAYFVYLFVVDDPHLQPRKDYDDYTRFINDTYAEEKEDMLNQTVTTLNRTGGFRTPNYNPIHTLRTYSEKPRFMNKRNLKGRNMSVGGALSETEKRMGSTMNDFDVKPKLLESKLRSNSDFFNISDGFKKVFAASDRKD